MASQSLGSPQQNAEPRFAGLRRPIKRLLTLICVLLSAGFLFSVLPLRSIRNDPELSTQIILALGLIVALFVRAVLGLSMRDAAPKLVADSLPSASADKQLADLALKAIAKCVTQHSLQFFMETAIDPGDYVIRITENVELDQPDYPAELNRTISLPERYHDQRILLAVLRPHKGQLVDNFAATANDKPVRTLSHLESQGVALLFGKALFEYRFPVGQHGDLWDDIESLIMRESVTPTRDQAQLRIKIDAALGSLLGAPDESGKVIDAALMRLVEECFTRYQLVALVDKPGATVKVKVSHVDRAPRASRASQNIFTRIREAGSFYLHGAYGATSRSHNLTLRAAVEARSYHFRARVPEGLYLFNARVEYPATQGGVPVNTAHLRAMSPVWRASNSLGREYVHAYGRDLDAMAQLGSVREQQLVPTLRLEFREKPPGVLLILILLSGYLAALTVAAGHWHDDVFRNNASAWPAVLFGIPAITSGWLVSRFTGQELRHVSVSTLALTGWCVANAGAAVAISALKLEVPSSRAMDIFTFHLSHPSWSLLTMSCASAFLMACTLLALRLRRFRRRLHDLSHNMLKS